MRTSLLNSAVWMAIWPGLAAAENLPLHFKNDDVSEIPWSALVLLALLVLVLLWSLAVAAHRRRGGRAARSVGIGSWFSATHGDPAIRIVASRRLGARTELHVVEWEGGKMLLAATEQQVAVLDRCEDGEKTS